MARDRLGGRKTLNVAGFLDEFEKDEVKQRVDIVQLFESFGVKLEKKGSSYIGLCPFHEDKNPSLSVSLEKGLFNCFGCGASGDQFDVVQKLKQCDFKESLSFLKKWSGNGSSKTLNKVTPLKPAPKEKPKEEPPKEEEEKTITLKHVAEYYHKQLYSHEEAIAYLEKRGITNPQTYKRFQLGFGGTLLSKLSEKQRKEMLALGILKTGEKTQNVYEHFHNCITIPLLDERGRIAGLYGRRIDKSLHLFMEGEHKGLINRKAIPVYPENIILTESPIDSLSLIQGGIENTIPCYGTNGFTELHLKALKEARVKTITIAFDSDEAGRTGSDRLKEKLLEEGFSVKQVFPHPVKDWNDYLTGGHCFDELKRRIAEEEALKPEEDKEGFRVRKEGDKYFFTRGAITYRLLGVREQFVSNFKVNIRPQYGELFTIDYVDLFSSRSRSIFSSNLSVLFQVEKQRIENDLLKIASYLEEQRDRLLASESGARPHIEITDAEKELGESFLKAKDQDKIILRDFETAGYVGEEVNVLLAYFTAISRLFDDPLSIYIQSTASTGKSALLDTLALFIPPESTVAASSFSDTALYYFDDDEFLNKVFMIGEAIHDIKIEGQIRQMQSEHRISRSVTVKNEKTGEMKTRQILKEVRLSFMMSSTALYLNQENASRCLVLHVDESREQTGRVLLSQRERQSSYRDVLERKHLMDEIKRKHITAQRLLENVGIYNPLAPYIRFPEGRPSMRRSQKYFLTLISSICLLRQRQKELKYFKDPHNNMEVEALACDLDDYALARRIYTKGVLEATKDDLPKGAVNLYESIRAMVSKRAREEGIAPSDVSFIQKQVRQYTGLGRETVKQHIRMLLEYEYLRAVSGRQHGTRYSYSLVEDKSISELGVDVIPEASEIEEKLGKTGYF